MINLIRAPSAQSEMINTLSKFSEAGALSRLISAAIVDQEFREQLLIEPSSVIDQGYNGEYFLLGEQVLDVILSIRAKTLAEFATKLLQELHHNQSKGMSNSSSASDSYLDDDFSES